MVDHYENFPVASWLVPPRLRQPIEAIYRFARSADDIADEGEVPRQARLRDLAAFRAGLDRIAEGRGAAEFSPFGPVFSALAEAVAAHRLPLPPFYDLLEAFVQDVDTCRYADFPELLDYCRRSANPVGRLMLHLFGRTRPEFLEQSDCICTALQLINFWQDVAIDVQKGRIYLPVSDLERFRVGPEQIAEGRWNADYAALMDFQIARTRALMMRGAPLVRALPGRLGWEIRLTVQGGLRILDLLSQVRGDVWRHRPRLGAFDWLRMAGRSFTM